MCDLIDLSSPDPRKSQAVSKLASPLIPGPETPVGEKAKTVDFILHYEKRQSFDNNPFDKVFKETSEYAAKKDDPFEAVLEKAQQHSDSRFDSPRSCYKLRGDFNFTPKKKKRHSDILRMNKTLEEPLLQGILNKNFQLAKSQQQNLVDNEINFNEVDKNGGKDSTNTQRNVITPQNSPKIIIVPPSPANCSVLNQSAMNDSLSETSCGSAGVVDNRKTTENISTCVKNGDIFPMLDILSSEIETELLKPSKHRRSLSQGNKICPEPLEPLPKTFRPRSKSIVDDLKVSDLLNKSRISSVSSTDTYNNADSANNAFMESGSLTAASESLDVSRISATPRLSCNSSSLYSCNSRNRAFLFDSQPISNIYGSASSAKSSYNLSSISRSTAAGNLLINTPIKTPVRIADLEMRFEKLKIQSMGSIGALPLYSPNHKVKSFLKSDGSQSADARETKLIDTDEFNAEPDEISDCSSDSVFIENNNADYSVFREAKLLARTFDKLAHQSTSGSFSSGDDLLDCRPTWNFDILPVSDDEEAVVDNLIELPTSPVGNKPEVLVRSSQKEVVEDNGRKESAESKVSEEIRDLESEFIDHDITRNKVMAATLLLDLEKIVHRENNPEAITLLENLEKVLGVKYESNAQLLATCLQGTNNLNKSPKKFVSKLVLKENIRHESLEKSDEDNNEDHEKSNSIKISNLNNNPSLGINLNIETPVNKSEKSVIVNISSQAEENIENEDLSEKSKNISNSPDPEDRKMLVKQNEALVLITNLSKILGGPNNDSSPLSLLTNLRQVLNLATNQLNFENSQMTKTSRNQELDYEIPSDIDNAQKKPSSKPTIDAIKTGRKTSIDSSAKLQSTTAPRLTKRSMSFGSGQRNSVPIATVTKEKGKPHPRIFKKALSCSEVPKPVFSDKSEKTSTAVPGIGRSRASSISGTGKYKLKKKSESENVTVKKGPLKALLPVGNMQRRGSMSIKVAPTSLSRTPPKSMSTASPSSFQSAISSTPNPTVALVVTKKSPKTKPVASSTPDGGGSKTRRMRLQFAKNNTKPKFSCNISPVTPLPAHNITGSISSKGLAKNHRHNKTLSPPKRRSSGEALALNTTESSIPKYSPMSGLSRRNSRDSIKTLENSGSPKTSSNKAQTPKKSQFNRSISESQMPQSPLKTMNSQISKFKPFNLISKLRRGSNGSNVSDKENCT